MGEIRDRETAEVAVQAALTGHLLLSTVHANDTVGIMTRLRDMGVEPFLLASTLLGCVAQRLASRICGVCRTGVDVAEEVRRDMEALGIEAPRAFRGRGCPACHHTGCRGRIGLFELLVIDPCLRRFLNQGADEEILRGEIERRGFRTILSRGLSEEVRAHPFGAPAPKCWEAEYPAPLRTWVEKSVQVVAMEHRLEFVTGALVGRASTPADHDEVSIHVKWREPSGTARELVMKVPVWREKSRAYPAPSPEE